MKTTDYASMPLGTKIDNGEIQTCPVCEKAGLAEKVGAITYFTHFHTVGFNDKGLPEMDWKWHRHPPAPKATPEAAEGEQSR